jgi:hypothetical protein
MLAALVVRSRTACDTSAAVCVTSRSLIAPSMTLMRRFYPLTGAPTLQSSAGLPAADKTQRSNT